MGTSFSARAHAGVTGLVAVGIFFGLMRGIEAVVGRATEDVTMATRVATWLARPKWRCAWPWLLVGAGAAGVANLAWMVVVPVVDRLWSHGPAGTYNDVPDHPAATVWAATIALVLCAPILEELLFRGGLQSWLGRRLPRTAAVLVATAVFAAVHGAGAHAYNSVQLAGVFFSGLVFALLYELSGSVMPGILSHMVWNGFNLVGTLTVVPIVVSPLAFAAVGAVGITILATRRGSSSGELNRATSDSSMPQAQGVEPYRGPLRCRPGRPTPDQSFWRRPRAGPGFRTRRSRT